MRAGIWVYVWQDIPTDHALDSYDGALVRAANGVGTTNPSGFDFAANYDRWVARFGADRVQPWTYLYPSSDGARAAQALFGSAGKLDTYQCDLEDAVPPAAIKAFCDKLHELSPGCQIVFDSYPTRAQFIRVNGSAGAATWDQAVRSFDVFCPQVYFTSQFDDGWEREFAGKPIWPAFSPANTASWPYFQSKLDQFGVANLWRYPMTDAWRNKLTFEGDDMTVDEMVHEFTTPGTKLRIALLSLMQRGVNSTVGAQDVDTDGVNSPARKAISSLVKAEVAPLLDDETKVLTAIAAIQQGDPGPLIDVINTLPDQVYARFYGALTPPPPVVPAP